MPKALKIGNFIVRNKAVLLSNKSNKILKQPLNPFTSTFLGTKAVVCTYYKHECVAITANKIEYVATLTTDRTGAGSVTLNGEILWITGGFDSTITRETLSSSDFVKLDTGTTEGINGGNINIC